MKHLKTITVTSGFVVLGIFSVLKYLEAGTLKDQNAALEKKLAICEKGSRDKELQPIGKQALIDGINKFENEQRLKIPSAWVFEKDTLKIMLDHVVGNESVKGLMAYPMVDAAGYLKIALVPYYINNKGVRGHFTASDETLKAYNYSDMVPTPGGTFEHAAANDNELEVDRAIRNYKPE